MGRVRVLIAWDPETGDCTIGAADASTAPSMVLAALDAGARTAFLARKQIEREVAQHAVHADDRAFSCTIPRTSFDARGGES